MGVGDSPGTVTRSRVSLNATLAQQRERSEVNLRPGLSTMKPVLKPSRSFLPCYI